LIAWARDKATRVEAQLGGILVTLALHAGILAR